eukprot:921171-Pyramimonas_sp.AAC.1
MEAGEETFEAAADDEAENIQASTRVIGSSVQLGEADARRARTMEDRKVRLLSSYPEKRFTNVTLRRVPGRAAFHTHR